MRNPMTNDMIELAVRIIHRTHRVHLPSERGTGISMAPYVWANRAGSDGLILQICAAAVRQQKRHEIRRFAMLDAQICIGGRSPFPKSQVVIMSPETLRIRHKDVSTDPVPYMVVVHCVKGSWHLIADVCEKSKRVVIFSGQENLFIDNIINGG